MDGREGFGSYSKKTKNYKQEEDVEGYDPLYSISISIGMTFNAKERNGQIILHWGC